MNCDSVIIGCGVRSPVGFERGPSAAAVRAGISVIAEHPFMTDRFGDAMMVTRDAELDPHLEGHDRLSALAIPAARSALAPLMKARRAARIAIVVGLGSKRPGLDDRTGAVLAGRLGDALRGDVTVEEILHSADGHAAGILAMETALRWIAEDRFDAVLAGGVDSYMSRDTLEWLDDTEQLHSMRNIYGFCPGEAAGFVLVARRGTASRMGLVPLVDLVAVGTGVEKNLNRTEDICLGEGLAAAFRGATKTLGGDVKLDQVLCDMNGERYRGNEYGFAVLRSPGLLKDAAKFEAPADCWGDVGAASGPLYASLVIEAEARGYSRGPLSLIWTSSAMGQRAAALLRHTGVV